MIPHHERIFADNIGGRPQATDFIDSFLPVDVVYTWVNGSGKVNILLPTLGLSQQLY